MDERDWWYPEDFPWDGAFVVRDVQRKPWWPYRPVDGEVDALWMLGEEGTPTGLFGRLVEGWGAGLDWFVAGTSIFRSEAERPSWTAQYPGLGIEMLARMTFELEFPFDHRYTEWWRIDPRARELCPLLQDSLRHPGSGWWMAASADEDAGARFVRATTGLLWWDRRDYRPYQGPKYEMVDSSVIEALLGLLPQIGLMSVVPLNNHPVSGVVLFGVPEAIRQAAASLGGVRESEGEEVVKMWARAGWLATL